MKLRRMLLLLMMTSWWSSALYPQVPSPKASEYFPRKNGSVWNYSQVVLDSLQLPIDSTMSIRKDQMIGYTVLDIDGVEWTTQWIKTIAGGVPDTVKWSTYQNTVKRPFDAGKLFPALTIDSLGLSRFNGTYTVMNFFSGVNTIDTLIRFDTTVTIDSMTFPVRFSFTSKKLAEQLMSVSGVKYTVTPFVFKFAATVLYPSFIGTIKIPIVEFFDSTFVAKDMWIVRRVVPSTVIPKSSSTFALLGVTIPEVKVPGMLEELRSFVLNVGDGPNIVHQFRLEQNYPNPFNPSTTISYFVPERQNVIMRVFDILGRSVAEPMNSLQESGYHTIQFRGDALPSGVYFYRLQCGTRSETKKMLLQK
ncbi:MAG: T9SS type A sorting domain-containing protein [Bacteroidota bacterium]